MTDIMDETEIPDDASDVTAQSIAKLVSTNLDRFAHLPPEKVAWRIMCDVDSSDWRNVLLPVVLAEVRRIRRARANAYEQAVDSLPVLKIEQNQAKEAAMPRQGTPGSVRKSAPEPAIALSPPNRDAPAPGRRIHLTTPRLADWMAKNRDLLDQPLSLGDGHPETSWRFVTAEQLEDRVVMLERSINGTQQTVDRMRKWQEMLRAEGVSCAADLFGDVAA